MNYSAPFTLMLVFFTSVIFAQNTYWQQEVNTTIEVTLDDVQHVLRGKIEMEYINHSPDTLHQIYLHLWPNAYKNDRTAFCNQQLENRNTKFYFSKPEDRGFIDSLDFHLDGVPYFFNPYDGHIDIAQIDLKNPLLPNQSIRIETPFRVKIPKVFSRLGHIEQDYYISQWFPKPAVYDRQGWHPIPYLDQGEFYSEFGKYEVNVTLPKNYVVLGSGKIEEESEINFLQKKSVRPDSGQLLQNAHTLPSSTDFKTVHFKAEHTHDFAWFASKDWWVDVKKVTAKNGQSIQLYTAYHPSHFKYWQKAISILEETLERYEEHIGTYGYPVLAAVDGQMSAGGGMEYPMITVIDQTALRLLPEVIAHEAGHNWFYGMLGSNERSHPWMDEGLNTFYEEKPLKNTIKLSDVNRMEFEKVLLKQNMNTGEDQPVHLHAEQYTYLNYGLDVYQKTAAELTWLEAYLGEDIFSNIVKDYFKKWKFKHPYPEDFETSFRIASPKNLDWFFDVVLPSRNDFDFNLKSVKKINEETIRVKVRNRSGRAVPAIIDLTDGNFVLSRTVVEPFLGEKEIDIQNDTAATQVMISKTVLDLNLTNNALRLKKGKKIRGWSPAFFAGIRSDSKHKTWFGPSIGYNKYDGFMTGIFAHNLTLPQYRFQYAGTLLYSTKSKSLVGGASLGYSFFNIHFLKELQVQLDAKSYHNDYTSVQLTAPLFARYSKWAPALRFYFKQKNARVSANSVLTLKGHFIREEGYQYIRSAADSSIFYPTLRHDNHRYLSLNFRHENRQIINPYGYEAELQLSKNFTKINLAAHARLDYHLPGKGFHVRGYVGKIFHRQRLAQRYYLYAAPVAENDYLYEGTFVGRSEQNGFWSQQTLNAEGQGALNTRLYSRPLGASDNWLLALNLKTDLPVKLPIRLYANFHTYADYKLINPSGNAILFGAGLELHLFNDFLSINVPLLTSKDYTEYYKSMYGQNYFWQRISFRLKFKDFNILRTQKPLLNLLGN